MTKKQPAITVGDDAKFTTDQWTDSDGNVQWRLRIVDGKDTWVFEPNEDQSTQITRSSKNTHH